MYYIESNYEDKMSEVRLAPFKVTEKQRSWLIDESKRTGDSIASILRKLIQEKIK